MVQLTDLLKQRSGLTSKASPLVRSGLLAVTLLSVSVVVALLMASVGWVVGALVIVAVLGIPLLWMCFSNPLYAVTSAVVLSYFIFVVKRISGIYDLPTGTVVDAILVIGAVGVLFKKGSSPGPINRAITFTFALTVLYLILQAFNPNAYNIEAWLNLSLRTIITRVCIFIITLYAFQSKKDVMTFTTWFLVMSFIAALYGMYQEWVGLPEFDLKWVMSDPLRYKLFFINGKFRKWSILGEVSSFGVVMAFSSITALALMLGPYRNKYKIMLFVAALCMILGMGFSGTRTAYVMLPIGVAFYVLLTINKRRTLIFAAFAAVIGVAILYGPFYGGTLSRIRTAFNPSEDASMQVREQNRAMIQPYMYSHPIGGGIGTTGVPGEKYHPGHILAGFPPDSGYMIVVLETGYIGLLLTLSLYFLILMVGVRNYFRTQDLEIKNLYLAYMAPFFAITIGNIAQNAVSYPPADIILVCIVVFMFKLRSLESKPFSSANETI